MGWGTLIATATQAKRTLQRWGSPILDHYSNPLAGASQYVADFLGASFRAFKDLDRLKDKKVVAALSYIVIHQLMDVVMDHCIRVMIMEELPNIPANSFLSYGFQLSHGVLGIKIAYTSLELLGQISIIEAIGPAELIAPKKQMADKHCQEQCVSISRFKGQLREPIILLLNDSLAGAIHLIPKIGPAAAYFILFPITGKMIIRSILKGCDKHKDADLRFLICLGGIYYLSLFISNQIISNTLGTPPFIIQWSIRHLSLLAFIYISSYLDIPLPERLSYNPLFFWEDKINWLLNVLIAGFTHQNASSDLGSFSLFKKITSLLNADLKTEEIAPARPIKSILASAHSLVPTLYRYPLQDPVFNYCVADLIELAKEFLKQINEKKERLQVAAPVIKMMPTTMKTASSMLYLIADMLTVLPGNSPLVVKLRLKAKSLQSYQRLVNIFAQLNQNPDFWHFVSALKRWVERQEAQPISLVKGPQEVLATLHTGTPCPSISPARKHGIFSRSTVRPALIESDPNYFKAVSSA